MKLYYPKDHYDSSFRGHVFPLLKPFIKPDGFSDKERISIYGVSEQDFKFVNQPAEADIVILTMSWWYYYNTNQLKKAINFIEVVNNLKLPVLIIIPGDNGIDIPKHLNFITVRAQGYKSKLKSNHHSLSVFIDDPLKIHYNTTKIIKRIYSKKPVIGFCGQANLSKIEAIKDMLKTTFKNGLYYLKLKPQKAHQLIPTKYLRAKLVYSILNDKRINSNFILRKKYRAGVNSAKQKSKHKTTIEFYDNMINSDYVLCVRGAGNFSVRLYETLAMGRIPVFINTDCILPHEDYLNWKDYVVWVDYKERNNVAQKVLDYHNNLDEIKLNEQFAKNRKFWETKLQLKPYFEILLKNLI